MPGRWARSLARLTRTRYPRFVWGLPPRPGPPPAFVYHEITPDAFRADLEFLRENDYATLTTDEFVAASGSGRSSRAVLLTFDDAFSNFWEVTFPLLLEYGARVTVFAPTYWISGSGDQYPEAMGDQPERQEFANWEQLKRCVGSGLVDVQPHGHRHALVYRSDALAGFVSPSSLRRYHLFEWPMRREGGSDRLGRPPLGTPVFRAEPLLSAHKRHLEDTSAVEACREAVAVEGSDFFARPDWESRLRDIFHRARHSVEQRCVEGAEYGRLIVDDLESSCRIIEEQLGYRPRHLAFPWHWGSDTSESLARDLGLRSLFGVATDFGRARRLGGQLRGFARYKSDWLRFLPGRNRASLSRVIRRKARQQLQPQHLTH